MMPNSCTRTVIWSGSGKYSAGDADDDDDDDDDADDNNDADMRVKNLVQKKELSACFSEAKPV